MNELSDDELILELKSRFDQTKQALYDLKMITKKLEVVNKKLQASEQVKSTFVSLVKNEINNPLTAILGLTEQLNGGKLDQETVTTVTQMIHNEAFSLDFQLRNIFAAAELESGETGLQISVVDVNSLVRDAMDSFSHLSQEKGVQVNFISTTPIQEPLLFKTDSEKLSLVMTNLLSNAIEFNQQGGKVEINLNLADNQLFFSIVDTGQGIDTGQLQRLFDRFTQMDSGVRKSHKGHGLGLSITKAAIDLMGGTVSVDSPDGQGCIVNLQLPMVETDADADAFSVDGNEFFFDDDQVEVF